MQDETHHILTVLSLPGIGPAKARKVVSNCSSLEPDELIYSLKKLFNYSINESEWKSRSIECLDKIKLSLD